MQPLGPRDIEEIAEKAAHSAIERIIAHRGLDGVVATAVRETLQQIGIDTSRPIEVQKDFTALRNWRQTGEEVRRRSIFALLGIFLSGFIALIVMGFRAWIDR